MLWRRQQLAPRSVRFDKDVQRHDVHPRRSERYGLSRQAWYRSFLRGGRLLRETPLAERTFRRVVARAGECLG